MRTEPPPAARGSAGDRTGGSATLVIDVGATRTRLAIVDRGTIVERRIRPTAELVRPGDGIVGALADEARRLAGEVAGPPIEAAGVGLAACVNDAGGVLIERDFGIPAGTGLRDALKAALRVPVAFDNDANLAALAEHRLGAARGRRTAAVMTLGTNIGLGLIVDGHVHRGARGAAGEAGLVLVPTRDTGESTGDARIVDAGPLGRAASRAPEAYAWIEELVGGGALAAAADQPAPDDAARGRATARVLTAEALADPRLRPLADRAVEGWSLLIATLSVLVDPEVVVLSGELAADAAHLLERLRRRVAELAPFPPDIRLGQVGADAELLGADLLARSVPVPGTVGHARAGLTAQSRGGVA